MAEEFVVPHRWRRRGAMADGAEGPGRGKGRPERLMEPAADLSDEYDALAERLAASAEHDGIRPDVEMVAARCRHLLKHSTPGALHEIVLGLKREPPYFTATVRKSKRAEVVKE